MKVIVIEGDNISDIASFYDEINRVMMAGEDWKLGHSLDALNDLFYGGFGLIKGNEPLTLVWRNLEKNQSDLGLEATRKYYQNKLRYPKRFDCDLVKRQIAELDAGIGKNYMEIILEIIADHPNIKLVAD